MKTVIIKLKIEDDEEIWGVETFTHGTLEPNKIYTPNQCESITETVIKDISDEEKEFMKVQFRTYEEHIKNRIYPIPNPHLVYFKEE